MLNDMLKGLAPKNRRNPCHSCVFNVIFVGNLGFFEGGGGGGGRSVRPVKVLVWFTPRNQVRKETHTKYKKQNGSISPREHV